MNVMSKAITPRQPGEGPPSAGQIAAVRKLPDNAKPNFPAVTHKISSDIYFGEERYRLEQERAFRRLPLAIAPSAMLAPGSYVCRNGYGVPIIVTRDKQGIAHAFLNACRHRGSRLVQDEDAKKAGLFVCPYHAWSYDLTGTLRGVPREEVFEPLDKQALGLVELKSEERGGIIWVKIDKHADDDFSHLSDELITDLDALGVADMHLFAHRRHDVAGNWKLILDTFLEGYHVIRLHANTLGNRFEDTVTQVDRLGAHLRQTSGRPKFTQALAEERAHSIDLIRRAVTFVYTLVPNCALIVSQDYVNLLVFSPQGPARTLVDNFMLTNRDPAGDDKLAAKWQRSLDLTDGQAFPEDFFASAECQVGLSSGAAPDVYVGGLETAMIAYHRLLDEILGQGEAA